MRILALVIALSSLARAKICAQPQLPLIPPSDEQVRGRKLEVAGIVMTTIGFALTVVAIGAGAASAQNRSYSSDASSLQAALAISSGAVGAASLLVGLPLWSSGHDKRSQKAELVPSPRRPRKGFFPR